MLGNCSEGYVGEYLRKLSGVYDTTRQHPPTPSPPPQKNPPQSWNFIGKKHYWITVGLQLHVDIYLLHLVRREDSLNKAIIRCQVVFGETSYIVPWCGRKAKEDSEVPVVSGLKKEGMGINPSKRRQHNQNMITLLQVAWITTKKGEEIVLMLTCTRVKTYLEHTMKFYHLITN